MQNRHLTQKNSRKVFKILFSVSRKYFPKENKIKEIFVAGCGKYAIEAIEIAKLMPKSEVTGLDIELEKNIVPPKNCELIKSDLQKIEFNKKFDLIYCFHVIEHIKNHHAVLKKISSLLSPSGVLIIGFPNINRIISYINPVNNKPILTKVKLNLNDYYKRLRGEFYSPSAHAGFSEARFRKITSHIFSISIPLRTSYYISKYPRFALLIKIIKKIGLDEFLFPSNYFLLKNEK